jgi:hypothetical protein
VIISDSPFVPVLIIFGNAPLFLLVFPVSTHEAPSAKRRELSTQRRELSAQRREPFEFRK